MKTQIIMRKRLQLLFSLIALSGYSQINPGGIIQNSVNSIAPKSPDAAALFRYTETPVSLYTGVPDINIPLYTIKEGDIELPISISYHAGGIKVTDDASSVGLGWSLNAGGRVSQVMAGVNDFSLYGYYTIYPKNLNLGVVGIISGCQVLPWNNTTQTNAFYSNNFVHVLPDYNSPQNYIGLDYQPDLFLINLPNQSYKAYLDMAKTIKPPNGNIKFAIAGQPNIDFKLTGTPGAGGGYNFQVTDQTGIKYYFDKDEITTPAVGSYYISGYSRLLSKIEDTKGNDVVFSYSQGVINSRLGGCKNTVTDFTYNAIQEGFTKQNGLTVCSKQEVGEHFLERIDFTNGTILFDWTDRDDINNSKKLSSIRIFNKTKLIKEYDFSYDYFVANDNLDTGSIATWLGASDNKIFTHRLKLLGLTNPLSNEKYSFNYNSTYNLPNKLSFSTDFWGYFNGQNNSDTFIPNPNKYVKGQNVFNVTYFNKDSENYWYEATATPYIFTSPGGGTTLSKNYSSDGKHYLSDRRTSLYSLAGMLTAINYPTGGKTEYDYEPNTFSNYPLQSLINDNTAKQTNANASINIINGNVVHTNNPSEFNIIGSGIKVNISAHFGFYYLTSASYNTKNSFWLYIKNKSTGEILKKVYNTNVGSYQTTFVMDNVILQPGTYEVGMSHNNDFAYNSIYTGGSSAVLNSCTIKYSDEKSIINGVEYNYSSGGGIRIKSIKSTEKPGATPIVKNYIYDEITNNGTKITSNGNLADFPKFFEIENRCFDGAPLHDTHGPSIISNPTCTSSGAADDASFKISVYEGTPSQGTSTLPQGNYVGYSKVTEQVTGKGKTESYFVNNYNQSCINMAARGNSLVIGDGDMTKQIIYDNSDNKIKETLYNYKFNYPDNLNTYYISAIILEPVSSFIPEFTGYNLSSSYNSYAGLLHTYSINLWKSLLDYTSTKEYFSAGSTSYVETKTYNTYNNKYLTSKQSTTFPDQSILETNYQYAYEKNKTKLIEANMVSIPLETEVKKNGKTISKTETLYPETLPDTQAGNLLLPKSVSALDLVSGGMSTEVTYNQYDNNGNLQQYTNKAGVSTSIIWDKSQTQPIAKVEGAKLSDITQTLIDSIVNASDQSQAGYTEANLLAKLDAFRNDTTLKGFQITTYTYKPLIGVSSITPPSGIREVYIYDTANRLKEVRDVNGNLLKSNEYHYRP